MPILSNLYDGAAGLWNGLTGQSRRKKQQARERQKQANQKRQQAQERQKQANDQLQRTNLKVNQIDARQDRDISAARALANRSLQTVRSSAFESKILRDLVDGMRSDLKTLSSTAASTKSLDETNKLLSEMSAQLKTQNEATLAYRESVDEAIDGLNKEAAETTKHIEAIIEESQKKGGQFESLATDVLPWLRTAVQALNIERPSNKTAYYAYLASQAFLKGRLEPTYAELITTALQMLAYWDEDGIAGLFESRPVIDVSKQEAALRIAEEQAAMSAKFFSRADVRKALNDANIKVP